jgi:hypothetical protein
MHPDGKDSKSGGSALPEPVFLAIALDDYLVAADQYRHNP